MKKSMLIPAIAGIVVAGTLGVAGAIPGTPWNERMVSQPAPEISEEHAPQVAQFLAGASDDETAMLEDGEVTAEEYATAVQSVVACLDAHGIPHDEPLLLENQHIPHWQIGIGPISDPRGEQAQQASDCQDQYLSRLTLAWEMQHEPSEEVRLQREQDAVACAQDEGLDVDTMHDLLTIMGIGDEPDREVALSCYGHHVNGFARE